MTKQQVAEVPDYQALQKCRVLVFNRFAINVYGITGHQKDTEFTYLIYTDQRINKSEVLVIQNYIMGIVDTLKSF